ncbi:hypothetical protein Zmor_018627 [Zophobas morio]|uniref:oleoyl-[acyl-carrier-protein] hydrolase n=2 Tax=Zophobas morio TaxID=2755281 RepID=A0AA38ICP7_9CUCU|nr:hypothetical protein Zmor_018627 [Zophobas morio]
MDSMMGVEIVQLLEKDFGIYLTSRDARNLTFAKLAEMEEGKMNKFAEVLDKKTEEGENLFIQYIPNRETVHLPAVKLNSHIDSDLEAPIVFVLPGVESIFKPLEYLTNTLKAHVVGVQYSYDNPEDSIKEIAQNTLPHIENYLSRDSSFYIIGYSFGTLVALEMISLLEEKGYTGILILIDSSPAYSSSSLKKHFAHETDAQFQTAVLMKICTLLIPLDVVSQYEEMLKCKNFEERIDLLLSLIPLKIRNEVNLEKQACIALYNRCKAVFDYTFENKKIQSSTHLFKAKYPMVDEADDYQLSEVSDNVAQVTAIDGDHVTILKSPGLVKAVSKIVVLKQ